MWLPWATSERGCEGLCRLLARYVLPPMCLIHFLLLVGRLHRKLWAFRKSGRCKFENIGCATSVASAYRVLIRSACEDHDKVKSKRGSLRNNWQFWSARFILRQQDKQKKVPCGSPRLQPQGEMEERKSSAAFKPFLAMQANEKSPPISPCHPIPTPSGSWSHRHCNTKKNPQ